MGGWTCADNENIFWDGTINSKNLKVSDTITVKNIEIGTTNALSNIHIDDADLLTGTGTFSCNGTTGVVTGTNSIFTQQLQVGTLVQFVTADRWVQVIEIVSDTSMVVFPPVSTSGTYKYVRQGAVIKNQGFTVWGTAINDGNDEPVHMTFDPQAPIGNNGAGFFNLTAASNTSIDPAGNIKMFHIIDRNQGSPYFQIENQNGSGTRVGFLIGGVRSAGSAFFQGQGSFRMETAGGGLGEISSCGVLDTINSANLISIGDHQFNNNGTTLNVDDGNTSIDFNTNQLQMNGTAGFTGSGAYTNFTFANGICTNAS